jgi:Tol biopolymer transport system component
MKILHIPLAALAVTLLAAASAQAFHKSTPAIVPLSAGGDVDLPRVPPQGRRAMALVLPEGAATKVVSLSPHKTGSQAGLVFSGGDNRNPAVSVSGKAFAWDTDDDPLGSGAPGRQVIMNVKGALIQAAVDPTGTSTNPALDKSGRRVVFESEGDLAGNGNAGARQIFMREPTGLLLQVSSGQGDSRNAMLSGKGRMLSYESSSHPTTGADTGVAQVFVGRYDQLPAARITAGVGPSRNPSLSDDGRLVVFESLADLAGTGANTGVPEIFAYDVRSQTFAQLTSDGGGCTDPAANRFGRDWRITFICGGEAQFFMLRENVRYRVQTPGGTSQSTLPELGSHFVLLSTTANLFSGGTTAGHQIYMVNLFARPAEEIPGTSTWFPFQGIRPL